MGWEPMTSNEREVLEYLSVVKARVWPFDPTRSNIPNSKKVHLLTVVVSADAGTVRSPTTNPSCSTHVMKLVDLRYTGKKIVYG